jgi:hypothetical protein
MGMSVMSDVTLVPQKSDRLVTPQALHRCHSGGSARRAAGLRRAPAYSGRGTDDSGVSRPRLKACAATRI